MVFLILLMHGANIKIYLINFDLLEGRDVMNTTVNIRVPQNVEDLTLLHLV
jgi:hypothetical protein